MNVDPLVADRGLDCCCEVDVRAFLHVQQFLTHPS